MVNKLLVNCAFNLYLKDFDKKLKKVCKQFREYSRSKLNKTRLGPKIFVEIFLLKVIEAYLLTALEMLTLRLKLFQSCNVHTYDVWSNKFTYSKILYYVHTLSCRSFSRIGTYFLLIMP